MSDPVDDTDHAPATDEVIVVTEKKSRLRIWIGRLLKILFVFAAIMLIGLVVLANMGGSSDVLKKSVEDYIAENTSYTAKIAKFNGMAFFPEIIVDFEGLLLSPQGNPNPVAKIDKARVVLSFWDVMSSTGKMKFFDVRGVETVPNSFFKTPLKLARVGIVDSEEGARFELTGSLNNIPLNAFLTMEEKGLGRNKKFMLGPERDLKMTLGEIEFSARLLNNTEYIAIEDIALFLAGKTVVSGKLNMEASSGKLAFSGGLNMEEHKTDLHPEIEIFMARNGNPREVTGTIRSASFHIEDFSAQSDYDRFIKILEEAFGAPEETLKHDVKLDIQNLYKAGAVTGSYQGPLPLEGWRIDTARLSKESP